MLRDKGLSHQWSSLGLYSWLHLSRPSIQFTSFLVSFGPLESKRGWYSGAKLDAAVKVVKMRSVVAHLRFHGIGPGGPILRHHAALVSRDTPIDYQLWPFDNILTPDIGALRLINASKGTSSGKPFLLLPLSQLSPSTASLPSDSLWHPRWRVLWKP